MHEDVVDVFVAKLQVAMSKLKLGSGLEQSTTVGPLINERAVERVQGLLADAVKKGASVSYGGTRPDPAQLFVAPTIVRDVKAVRLHVSVLVFYIAMWVDESW